MGFIIYFYIIFGTNLLTQRPTPDCCFFCLFQCFAEKEYQTESKRNETFGRVIFGTTISTRKTWSARQEAKELAVRAGARQGGRRAPLPRGLPVRLLTPTPSPVDHVCSKNHAPEGFIPFGLRLIFFFCETLK